MVFPRYILGKKTIYYHNFTKDLAIMYLNFNKSLLLNI